MVFAQITRDVSRLECGLGHMELKKENGEAPAHVVELVEEPADVGVEEPEDVDVDMEKNVEIIVEKDKTVIFIIYKYVNKNILYI